MPNASAPESHRSLSIWLALLLTAAVFFTHQIAGLCAILLRSLAQGLTFSQAAYAVHTDPVTLGALQAAVMGAAVFVVMRLVGGDAPAREVLGARPVPRRVLALCLVGGAAMQFPLAEVSNVVQERWPIPIDVQLLQRTLLAPDGWVDGFGAVFAFALVAPVGEELFFRGLLLPGLARRYGGAAALVATALLFGGLHLVGVATIAPAVIAGFVLGGLSLETRSVLPSIAAHIGNNGIILLLPESLVRIYGMNTVGEEVYHLDPFLVFGATAAMVACFGVVILSARDARDR